MAYICSRIVFADRTLTTFFNRSVVLFVLCVKKIDFTKLCIHMPVSSVSGRIYTIKEVNPSVYRFQKICRCTDTHQISRLVLRQIRNGFIEYVVHFFMGFTDCKSSDCIARQIQFRNTFCMINTDICINCTLIDTK